MVLAIIGMGAGSIGPVIREEENFPVAELGAEVPGNAAPADGDNVLASGPLELCSRAQQGFFARHRFFLRPP